MPWELQARAGCRGLCALLAVFTTACTTAHYPANPKLLRIDLDACDRASRVLATDPGDTLFMHLFLSGRGMRAAPFGFGVLEALRDTAIVWDGRPQRLIDPLDIMTAVSSGSILAASYALGGADGLAAFEARFLNASLQQELRAAALMPRSL
jgi:NTE family protein